MTDTAFIQMMGARIRSELNDLKRTPQSCASELGMDVREVDNVLSGNCERSQLDDLVDRMSRHYPIDKSELLLQHDDCDDGVRIMRAEESEASARVFERPDARGVRSPYYEYRDTAMARSSPINPEWIRELRVVGDNDPNNPDVSYNNGHFLHQMTFFLGPVNFYYEIDGVKKCVPMNTGDSNYIMPFFKHSFASRAADATALIVAVTFGAKVRRAQRELYALGRRGLKYKLDARSPGRRGNVQLIRRHMNNEFLTEERLRDLARATDPALDIEAILDERADIGYEALCGLARLLGVEVYDLMMPSFRAGDDVLVRKATDACAYWYPRSCDRRYRIKPLVRNPRMPLVKGFDVSVMQSSPAVVGDFEHALHGYVYNYGDTSVGMGWNGGRCGHHSELNPGDSVYVSPFVKHSFCAPSGAPGRLLMVSIGGAVDLATQRELSCFADGDRVIRETSQWFD